MGVKINKSKKVTGPVKGGFLEKLAAAKQAKPAQEVSPSRSTSIA